MSDMGTYRGNGGTQITTCFVVYLSKGRIKKGAEESTDSSACGLYRLLDRAGEYPVIHDDSSVTVDAAAHFALFQNFATRGIFGPEPITSIGIVALDPVHDGDRTQFFVRRVILFDDKGVIRVAARFVVECFECTIRNIGGQQRTMGVGPLVELPFAREECPLLIGIGLSDVIIDRFAICCRW